MKEIEINSFTAKNVSFLKAGVIRVVSWNINRGLQLCKIIEFLSSMSADLILLQEVDVYARRTGYQNIPQKIAQALHMNYVFGREFEELSQGRSASPAYHGQVTFSRFPILCPHILKFSQQSDFWRPRFFVPALSCLQRRLGARMALICEVTVYGKRLLVYNVHLESRGNDLLRISQFAELLMNCRKKTIEKPLIIAGDFNLDISLNAVAALWQNDFKNPFANFHGCPTVLHCRPRKNASIDGVLTSYALVTEKMAIYNAITASDHYPLFIQLRI